VGIIHILCTALPAKHWVVDITENTLQHDITLMVMYLTIDSVMYSG